MRENVEYWLVVAVARSVGRLPRPLARLFSSLLAFCVYWCFGRLRRVGEQNLKMAFPLLSARTRQEFLRC